MQLSKHLTTEMASVSKKAKELGISNAIPALYLKNALWLGVNIYDPVIEHFKTPPLIWAMYRNEVVNEKVGGDKNSWHKIAAAIDLDYDHLPSGTPSNSDLFFFLHDHVKEFHKLIWEMGDADNPGWVHIQGIRGMNSKIITLAYKNKNNESKYTHFKTLEEFLQFKSDIYGK